jgi:hypothetical protein
VHHGDGTVFLEQDKSARAYNPLSPWAVDLWKTISIWVEHAESDTEDNVRRYILFVTPLHESDFAKSLNDAQADADIDKLIGDIRSRYVGTKTKPRSGPHVERFLAADEATQRKVVGRMRVVSTDKDPVQPIRDRISIAVLPAMLDDTVAAIIGLASDEAARLIRSGKPAIIDGDTFKRRVGTVLRRSIHPGLLTSVTQKPSAREVDAVLQRRPVFIQQLDLIKLDPELKVRAVGDYLRSSADRSHWAETGQIFEGSFTDWDDDLISRHGLIASEIKDVHPSWPPDKAGRLIYGRCAALQVPLEGRAVPTHFVPGSFNSLANERKIGWHSDYLTLLQPEEA